MAHKGMDVEQVTTFGNHLKGGIKDQISGLKSKVCGDVHGLQWDGPDATQFKGDRLSQVSAAFDQLINKLEELGQTALNNAQAQDTTSTNV